MDHLELVRPNSNDVGSSMLVVSSAGVVRDQQHDEATSPNYLTTPRSKRRSTLSVVSC